MTEIEEVVIRSLDYYKNLIRDQEEIQLSNGPYYRQMRKAISELRAEGVIFIPVGDYLYRSVSHCTTEQIVNFAKERDASLKTEYFNTLHSVKKYLNKEQLDQLHFGGLFNE